MDLLLIYAPKNNNFYNLLGYFTLGNLIPMGLLAIADYVESRGHAARALHLSAEELSNSSFDLGDYVAHANPRIAAFSLHWHYQSARVIDEARKLKQRFPDLPILLGGYTAGLFADEILRGHPEIDYIIRGEGEVPTAKLIETLKSGGDLSAVPNLSLRIDDMVQHNPIAFVAGRRFLSELRFDRYELLENANLYFENFNHVLHSLSYPQILRKKLLPSGQIGHIVCVGRGCPVECSYCGGSKGPVEKATGRSHVTFRSIESIIKELHSVSRRGISRLYFPQDPYPTSNFYPRLFDAIRTEGLQFGAAFESFGLPPERLIDAFAKTFNSDDKSFIFISVETGDEKLRKNNRGYFFSNDDLLERLGYIEKIGLHFNICYTLGLPGESRESLEATNRLWNTIRRRYRFLTSQSATIIRLDPGSPAQCDPSKFQIRAAAESFETLLATHRNTHRESLGGWSHLPMNHECPTLLPENNTGAARQTERILAVYKCRHFCPLFDKGPFPYPINKVLCAVVGAFFRFEGRYIRRIESRIAPHQVERGEMISSATGKRDFG